MDDILSDLGVVTRTEQSAVQDALREKILSSVQLNDNPLLIPAVAERSVPKLSANSILRLSRSISQGVEDTRGDDGEMSTEHMKAVMKLRFLESLLGSGNSNANVAGAEILTKARERAGAKLMSGLG